jgi:perosamine synthetase
MTAAMIPHSRPWINEDDRKTVESVLVSGMIAKGDKVGELEGKVCNYLGVNHAVAQSSGTAALVLALRTLAICRGDEVILPTYVCRSVLESVFTVGATPVLCDVDETGVINAVTVAPHITRKTKAIIAVHIFGHPCDLRMLKQYEIPVIDDACQAFGLTIEGAKAGALGDIGVLSFHATKCLTTAEGGMLVTCNKTWGERARELTEGCTKPSSRNVAPLSDLQAVLGLSQLGRYSDMLKRRNWLRRQYTEAAQRLDIAISASPQSNMLFRFTLRSERPFETVQAGFLNQGINVRRGVDELLHRTIGLNDSAFPIAASLYQRTVSVPFYPSLSIDESTAVSDAFRVLKHGS